MTPGARVAAAIEVLERWRAGEAAEQALTRWARANRYAGSGDRAAIRDHVYDALRCRRSFAALGGAETGRGLMIGACRAAGTDPGAVFHGAGHAPLALTDEERRSGRSWDALEEGERLDCPDWLLPDLRAALGETTASVLEALRHRAPVFLRVNAARGDRDAAIAALSEDGITVKPHDLSPWALEVTGNPRRVRTSAAYLGGLVEVQDAASQAIVADLLPCAGGARILDFCAGGGGKALALAAACPDARVVAHDADPGRMGDLPARAARAGARIEIARPGDTALSGRFDLVLADAPCSGSGAWRRQPEAKWRLDPARLKALTSLQASVIAAASRHVAPGGRLAYATCSLLGAENEDIVQGFLGRASGWSLIGARRLTPLDGGDGFFLAQLIRC